MDQSRGVVCPGQQSAQKCYVDVHTINNGGMKLWKIKL